MDADDHVWTPTLEEVADITDSLLVEVFSRFGTKAIDSPIDIFHPVLLATQHPIVETDKLGSYFVRFFDGAHDAHGVGPIVKEFLDARDNSSRSGAMASARVR